MPEEKAGLISTALELLQPSFLSGYTFPHWIRLLRSNDWAVDGKYIPRALMATIGALATSALKPLEPGIELDAASEEMSRKPFFILGLNRSGTTHLFNLLAQTGAFGFPARLDCYNPHTFLLLRQIGLHRLLAKVPRKKREMDNVETGWLSPEEDCIAMQILGESCSVFLPFPRQWDFVSAWRSPYGDSQTAKIQFCNGLRNFSKKLVHLHRRPLLFKSPSHTSAIPEILSVFPQAKFVTIFRNPLHQTASMRAMRESGNPFWCALQWPPENKSAPLQQQGLLLRRYFQARKSIPASNLFETTFEELVADRAQTISRICERFSLRPPTNSEALEAKARNARPPRLPPDSWVPLIREHYKPLFDLGLYPRL